MLPELSIKDFLAKTAGDEPVPGGGCVSALNAALASALTEMVANLTIGKKKYEEKENRMKEISSFAKKYQQIFVESIDADSDAYNQVFAAFKLPKETEEEKSERSRQIQAATKIAADVPMEVARNAFRMLETISTVAREGNSNAVTDACVAMMAARTAILGALLNVRINLSSLKDETYATHLCEEADHLEKQTIQAETDLLTWVRTQL